MLRPVTYVLSILLLAGVFAVSGCAGHAVVGGHAHVGSASLVYVGPGVWVVRDYPLAVFYSSNYYWRYDGGVWYRSRDYRRGWVRVRSRAVPARIRRIDRPQRYARHHGKANARVRRAPRHHAPKRHHRRHKHH